MSTQMENLFAYSVPRENAGFKNVLIACMPKTGSSWLRRLVLQSTGRSSASLVPTHHMREQEIDLYKIMKNQNSINGWVAQHHVCLNEIMPVIFKRFEIFPVILVKGVYDNILSMHDHLHKELRNSYRASSHFSGNLAIPSNFCEHNFRDRVDYIIEFHMPWIIRFLKSWQLYRLDKNPGVFMSYEYLRHNTEKALSHIVSAASGNDIGPQVMGPIIDEVGRIDTMFNKGIVGRHKDFLDDDHKRKIARYFKYHKEYGLLRAFPVI